MKKTTFFIVVAMLCLFFKGFCQGTKSKSSQESGYKALKIGDRIPDLVFTKLINANESKISTKELFGKAIILDFWATWCTGCIAGFPHMEDLQGKFSKNLKVIMVNNSDRDNADKIEKFFSGRKADGFRTNIPSLFNEKSLDTIFPHRSIPHYVLIGPDGRIKAITDTDGVTEDNVKRLMAGLALEIKVKEQ